MAFVRKRVKTFKWPVKVEEPADGGVFEESTFDAIFKRVPRSEFQKLADKGDLELLKAVLTGWEGIEDEDGISGEISYQWLRDGEPIEGANRSVYTLTAQDAGAQISVVASYVDDFGTSEQLVSATAVVGPEQPVSGPVITPAALASWKLSRGKNSCGIS